jgi:hypothetical protein
MSLPPRNRNLLAALLSVPLAACFAVSPIGYGQSSIAPSIPAIQSIVPMGTVTQDPLIYGRDGTFSARIGDRSYWAFNDTAMRAYNVDGHNFISNTLAWTDSLNASNGIYLNHDHLDKTGVPIEYMPFTAAEQQFNYAHDPNHCTATPASTCGEDYAIWPGPLVAIPGTTMAYQFYGKVFRGGDVQGFQPLGAGIALEIGGKFIRPVEAPGTTDPTLMWQGDEVAYAGGALVESGLLYAIGCQGGFLVENCRVARVPVLEVLSKPAWRYYAGGGTWSSDPNAAITVFQGGAAGNSVFYDKALHQYLAIYSGIFNNNVYYRAAPHPWGPWSDETLLFVGQQGQSGTANYAALAHPEFEEDDGLTEYVTYVQTTGFLQQDLQLVKVTFQPNR